MRNFYIKLFSNISLSVKISLSLAFISTFTMVMFHHPDEVHQVLRYVAWLDKWPGVDNRMYWEHQEAMRSWLQPALYFLLIKLASLVLPDWHYLMKSITQIFHWGLLAMLYYFYSRRRTSHLISQKSRLEDFRWISISLVLQWYIPDFFLRHTSEAFSSILIALFIIAWHSKKEKDRVTYILMGVFAGCIFMIRFQMAFFLIPFIIIDVMISVKGSIRSRISTILYFALGGGSAVSACSLLDSYIYDRLVFSPYNYFYQNVILKRASGFGTNPWYWYLGEMWSHKINVLFLLIFTFSIRVAYKSRILLATWGAALCFFAAHSFVAHKEFRFIFPLFAIISVYVFLFSSEYLSGQLPRKLYLNILTRSYIQAPLVLFNLLLMIGAVFSPLTNHGEISVMKQIERMPNRPSKILFSQGFFAENNAISKRFNDWQMTMFRDFYKLMMPGDLKTSSFTMHSLYSTCKSEPDTAVLLSSNIEHIQKKSRLIEDYPSMKEEFRQPTSFEYSLAKIHASITGVSRDTSAYSLVRCNSLVSTIPEQELADYSFIVR